MQKRIKKLSAFMMAFIVLMGLLTTSAFAAWPVYGGNDTHNAVVTDAPTSTSSTATEIDLLNPGTGWDGVDNVPVMRTVGSDTYAFVLYDGHSAGSTLARVKCNSTAEDKELVNLQVNEASGFKLSTPLLVQGDAADGSGDVIYLASTAGAECLEPLNGADWTFSANLTPSNLDALVTTGAIGTYTIAQANVPFNANSGYRLSLGVWIGTTESARGAVTVKAYIDGQLASVIDNSASTTDPVTVVSFSATDAPIEDPDIPGNYYHYYNVNLADTSVPTTGNHTVAFEVYVSSGNTSTVPFKITNPSVLRDSGSIAKITNLYGERPVADGSFQPTLNGSPLSIAQQPNTPITTDGTYLYFGTWSGNSAGHYYQVKISDGTTKEFVPDSRGFYWAGAVSDGTNVYFGSDNGMLYWRSIAAFDTTGGSLDLKNTASDAGNVRSTIMYDGSDLYFTSQGGYLWCCNYTAKDGLAVGWSASLGTTSTSTPTKVGDRIYVGCYSGFSAGGVKCVSASSHTVTDVASGFPVQCTVVVKGDGTGTDYVYFNTNSGTTTYEEYGCGYCYSFDGGTTGSRVWKTPNDTYALGGMAIENGYAVFGNDYNHLYVVE